MPNVDSLGKIIFGRNWFPWQPPRHLYHFSPATATAALTQAGFTTIVIRHNYWLQNHYILFQSLRYAKSPKFQKRKTGGLENLPAATSKKSLTVKLGKVLGSAMAYGLAAIEPVFKRGEVMLVSAKK